MIFILPIGFFSIDINYSYNNDLSFFPFIQLNASTINQENPKILVTNNLSGNNNDRNNLVKDILPPSILLMYDDKEYSGKLVEYNFRAEQPFSELRMPRGDGILDTKIPFINITQDSGIQIDARGYPNVLPPSNIGITVYSTEGESVKVLPKSSNNSNLFTGDLERGKYTLLVSSTWAQISDYEISGYVLYLFNVNVV